MQTRLHPLRIKLEATEPRVRPRATLRDLGVAALLLGMLVVAACGRKVQVPPPLLGYWKASGNARYEGASMEITENSIIFRKQPGFIDRNRIIGIDTETAVDKDAHTIHYRTFKGGETALALYHYKAPAENLIRFKFQPETVWRPAPKPAE